MTQVAGAITGIITTLSPSLSEITNLFTGFSKIPVPVLQEILGSLSEESLKKIATWGQTFIAHLNDVHQDVAEPQLDPSQPNFDPNFFQSVQDVRYIGSKLTDNDLELVSNAMTKAIKANNWTQAIMVGISIGKAGLV